MSDGVSTLEYRPMVFLKNGRDRRCFRASVNMHTFDVDDEVIVNGFEAVGFYSIGVETLLF